MASKPSAVGMLKTVGILYIIFAVLGFISVNLFTMNSGSSWLYLVLGVIITILAFSEKKPVAPMGAAPQM